MTRERNARADGAPSDRGLPPVLVVVDVDGVTSPVHGPTAWTDDVVVGNVLGPVVVSPTLVAHLDGLSAVPGVTCLWLTDWTPVMRAAMDVFPGRDWPGLQRADHPSRDRRWWKLAALHAWLESSAAGTSRESFFGSVVWLDDDLRSSARRTAVRRRLAALGLDVLLVAPKADKGVTPEEMLLVENWVRSRVEKTDRPRLDEAWRTSPVAPCGCPWDGWHCPHCGSVTAQSGDAWTPAHTLRCHDVQGPSLRPVPG